MIQGIRFKTRIAKNYLGLNDFNVLINLSQKNTFVGANNSGKSRLLRVIFGNENIEYLFEPEADEIDEIKKSYTPIVQKLENLIRYGKEYKYKAQIEEFVDEFENASETALGSLMDLHYYLSTVEKDEFELKNNNIFHILKLKYPQ